MTKRRWTLLDIDNFTRPRYFVFTSMLALLGVAAVTSNPRWPDLLAVLAVAVAFHVFAYVQNNVLDLPIDRTQPLRAKDPLVTGLIRPATAMLIAVLQIPISFLLTWWVGGGLWACGALVMGFSFMTVYNLYGKRCPIPMLTDAAQGIGWGSLSIYASLVASGKVNTLTFVAASFGFGFLFLINGVHGGLRDLGNDMELGCSTTAIYFGARIDDRGRVVSTRALRAFAYFALALYLGPASIALALGQFGYEGVELIAVSAAWVAISCVSFWILYPLTAPLMETRNQIIRLHGVPLLLSSVIIFLPRMYPVLVVAMLASHLLPRLIFSDPTRPTLRWFIRARLRG